MRKTYRYKDLEFPVADDEDVQFTVEFVSDGNMVQTVVNTPGDNDPEIDGEGTKLLGKGADLRGTQTICFSDAANPVPNEDHIRINFKINDKLLVEHSNEKSEEERPYIVLAIKFPTV
ncbi:hypothetical protein NC796_15015 [Aliifodinibius sp. S!AR15-10]|uniref:hypothetical protein n=1 Tax=Aliifodinibius sp. S!AR15-10 TaxID=2950437 RepID=UPI002862804E|nr:hypothetical protein [Aliifodinibius sp. S!AR15-10]MDR8392463.1 hypothetical protein [Aliifodinibius sp. S!AR15-10]